MVKITLYFIITHRQISRITLLVYCLSFQDDTMNYRVGYHFDLYVFDVVIEV
jgi:hypothetical protein